MFYDTRNRKALNTLAPNTKKLAYKFYQYCLDHNIDILITEGKRSLATQKANVAKGASQTLRSYHLVGQAFDFVPVVSDKGTISYSHYKEKPFIDAVKYAKSIGFEWGGDWKSFNDSPHLQYKYKGYGTDKTLLQKVIRVSKQVPKDLVPFPGLLKFGSRGKDVERVQRAVKVKVTGVFDKVTKDAVRDYQARKGLKVDGLVGQATWSMLF